MATNGIFSLFKILRGKKGEERSNAECNQRMPISQDEGSSTTNPGTSEYQGRQREETLDPDCSAIPSQTSIKSYCTDDSGFSELSLVQGEEKKKYEQSSQNMNKFTSHEYKRTFQSYLDSLGGFYFCSQSSSFKNLKSDSCHDKDPWINIQLKMHKLEPDIVYPCIGFKFCNSKLENTTVEIRMKCRSLTEIKIRSVDVKTESLLAIFHCNKGKTLEADFMLSNLERNIVDLDNSDVIAWFHVAKFYCSLKYIRFTRYTGHFKTYYKSQCLDQLQKARTQFLKSGESSYLEDALTQWWAVLVLLDITGEVQEESTLILQIRERALELKRSDRETLLRYLDCFFERSHFDSFISD